MKVLHVITDLQDGGAEAVLYRLITNDLSNEHIVICLGSGGKYVELLENVGISVIVINIKKISTALANIRTLRKLLTKFKPEIIQGWMYHGNLFASMLGIFSRRTSVIWGIHHTDLVVGVDPILTRWISVCLAFLSRKSSYFVDSIVCCGEKSKAVHYEYGYALDKLTVIRNGYDTSFFNLNTQERNSFRDEMGVTDDLFLIGTVGRYAPQKDHANLLAALGQFKKTHNNFRLVLIGNGCEYSNAELMELVYNYDLAEYVYCLGSRADIVKVMNGLDLHVTSSAFGEAFPNVICEAMSCGTVCLTTDVGDASMIVGSRNLVVEASNDRELCQSLRNLYRIFSFEKETWNSMGVAARERIHKNYTIGIMVAQYNSVWNKD